MNTIKQPLPSTFAWIGWSNLSAQAAEQIALAAAPLTAVLLLNAGPVETSLLQTAQRLPFLLLAIPAGLLVDRTRRRGLMVSAELLRSLSLFGILVLFWIGELNLPLLAALGFFGAVGTVCFTVAAPALVPSIVPRQKLTEANRWLELARSTAYVAGPALGGAIIAWTGASAAYVIATGLSLLAAVLLVRVREPDPDPRPKRHPIHDLKEGAVFVAGHELLRPILVTAVFFNLSWFLIQAVFVPYAVKSLGIDAAGVGVIMALYGIGMVVGASLASWLSHYIRLGAMIVIGPSCGLVAAVLMLLSVWIPSGVLPAAAYFLIGSGPMIWTITTLSLRQAVTPNAMLGRVSALVTTATTGAAPLGAALGAAVAARASMEACLAVAVVGFAIQFLVIVTSAVPRLFELPEPA
ncbi:MFS transporter [Microvirga sp. 3-52]|nr:MFS transporter [Microvirga sp. 3-52]